MPLVKISDEGATEAFGIEILPSLVYFENGVPELYPGDLLNDDAILKWMLLELKQEEIKELTVPMLGMASNKNVNSNTFWPQAFYGGEQSTCKIKYLTALHIGL